MDLGCLDMGCIEKQISPSSHDDSEYQSPNGSLPSNSKPGKSKASKEGCQSNMGSLNKLTTQIKKPPRRKTSPLSWFPRKKVDSYLKRKIKLLQEVGGMNSTLDETLGDSNPHYSKVLKEKIAVREAAHKAMDARKAALVETSWCRILKSAMIDSKEAEILRLKAEKIAAEAFEAATAIGVVMFDIPDCPRKHCEIETAVNGGESTTHTVTASFETAFDVDKQVAAAVKAAFVKLANCSSVNKDDFKELLRKISQNPDSDENSVELSEFSSECESDAGSDLETGPRRDSFITGEMELARSKQIKVRTPKLMDVMLERLRCLQEEELASLATIVATCGLNAALAKAETSTLTSAIQVPRRMSSFGEGRTRKQVEADVPSLDKFLVKHMTRLEREVQEAKNDRKKDDAGQGIEEKCDYPDDGSVHSVRSVVPSKTTGLGSVLVKHYSKLEKEIEEAKKNSGEMFDKDQKILNSAVSLSEIHDLGSMLTIKHTSRLEKEIEESKRRSGKLFESEGVKSERVHHWAVVGPAKKDVAEAPSLDKYLVKHVSKLEREVQEAKNRRNIESSVAAVTSSTTESANGASCKDRGQNGKENLDMNKQRKEIEIGVKEKEIKPTLAPQNSADCSGPSGDSLITTEESISVATEVLSLEDVSTDSKETECSLDKVLVKPVHRLEREKMETRSSGSDYRILQRKSKYGGESAATNYESLDKVLVKHVSKLEKEKMALGGGTKEEVMKVKRRERNSQLEQSEGSLDQILVKHKSRLEREKDAAAEQSNDVLVNQVVVAKKEARERNLQLQQSEGSLDQILVKHRSRLEREKVAAASAEQPNCDHLKHHSVARKQAREKELEEAWGGLSFGNSMQPRLSRLQRDKAAWLKAEEEERRNGIVE